MLRLVPTLHACIPLPLHPSQLSLPHGSISARFEALATLLPVTRARLSTACVRRPLLLLGSVERLAGNLVGWLGTLLDCFVWVLHCVGAASGNAQCGRHCFLQRQYPCPCC